MPLLVILDCAVPGLALAQALGRFGNYFNQELFGGPTSLPWGLEIDPANRPAQYLDDATFHPTFLYESLWNLLVMAVLLRVARRWRRQPPGYVLALYLALYSLGRFFVEGLRVDPAHEIGPVPAQPGGRGRRLRGLAGRARVPAPPAPQRRPEPP